MSNRKPQSAPPLSAPLTDEPLDWETELDIGDRYIVTDMTTLIVSGYNERYACAATTTLVGVVVRGGKAQRLPIIRIFD
jgi:hypothetical protein